MRLLVDIGNTSVHWAFVQGAKLTARGDVVYRGTVGAARFAWLDQLAHSPTDVFAVNVAGDDYVEQLERMLAARFAVRLTVIGTGMRCGEVRNGYMEPEQLGADRWAAVVGAWHAFRSDVVVIDAGTALTVDLVGASGEHLGGLIVPGLALQQATLGRDTSDIAGFVAAGACSTDSDWFGRNTASAVSRGALHALTALVEKSVLSFPAPAKNPVVVLTGGDAEALSAGLSISHELRPQLVLEGLQQLVRETD